MPDRDAKLASVNNYLRQIWKREKGLSAELVDQILRASKAAIEGFPDNASKETWWTSLNVLLGRSATGLDSLARRASAVKIAPMFDAAIDESPNAACHFAFECLYGRHQDDSFELSIFVRSDGEAEQFFAWCMRHLMYLADDKRASREARMRELGVDVRVDDGSGPGETLKDEWIRYVGWDSSGVPAYDLRRFTDEDRRLSWTDWPWIGWPSDEYMRDLEALFVRARTHVARKRENRLRLMIDASGGFWMPLVEVSHTNATGSISTSRFASIGDTIMPLERADSVTTPWEAVLPVPQVDWERCFLGGVRFARFGLSGVPTHGDEVWEQIEYHDLEHNKSHRSVDDMLTLARRISRWGLSALEDHYETDRASALKIVKNYRPFHGWQFGFSHYDPSHPDFSGPDPWERINKLLKYGREGTDVGGVGDPGVGGVEDAEVDVGGIDPEV